MWAGAPTARARPPSQRSGALEFRDRGQRVLIVRTGQMPMKGVGVEPFADRPRPRRWEPPQGGVPLVRSSARCPGKRGDPAVTRIRLGVGQRVDVPPHRTVEPCQHEHACVRCPNAQAVVEPSSSSAGDRSNATPTNGSMKPARCSGSAKSPHSRKACTTSAARKHRLKLRQQPDEGENSVKALSR